MKYLLDTHVFLWYFDDSDKLGKAVADIIEDANVQKYVSIASLWEFAIKYDTGKLQFDGGLSRLWEMVTKNGFIIQPIEHSHIAGIIRLPYIHRDPFDRLLVATARADGMTLLTADENIHKYDVPSVWF
jgi:PIN domain nuclease of toxin-antitoxin system